MQSENKESIYPPILKVKYSERSSQTIQVDKLAKGTKTSESIGFPEVTFAIKYVEVGDFGKLWVAMLILSIVLGAFSGAYRVFCWMRRNDSQQVTGLVSIWSS